MKKPSINELLIKAARSLRSADNLRSRIRDGITGFREITGKPPSKIHLTHEQVTAIKQEIKIDIHYRIDEVTVFGIPVVESSKFKIS